MAVYGELRFLSRPRRIALLSDKLKGKNRVITFLSKNQYSGTIERPINRYIQISNQKLTEKITNHYQNSLDFNRILY